MTNTVEVYFDVVSPASYMAWARLPKMAASHNAQIVWKPFFLGGVMQATGNRPPGALPARGAYMAIDFARCAAKAGLPFAMNPHFPMNTLPIQRALAAWVGTDRFDELAAAAFKAVWVDKINVADSAALDEALEQANLSTDDFWAAANAAESKETVKALTHEAVARGAFGAPTMFVGEEMFFGQDRLDYVEDALRGA